MALFLNELFENRVDERYFLIVYYVSAVFDRPRKRVGDFSSLVGTFTQNNKTDGSASR
jgi:hypothetical protein